MSKWKIITAHGEYRPVAPGCEIEEIKWVQWGPAIIRRVVVHAVLCVIDSPCGHQYSTPAEVHNAIRQFQQPWQLQQPEIPNPWGTPPPWCTCDSRTGLDTAGEPDFYCPFHYPEQHRTRELMAADGYTRRIRAISLPRHGVPTWQQLPAAGKEMWRTWAECEMWSEDVD